MRRRHGFNAAVTLILLVGPTRWGDLGPLYKECAKAGTWQISFVGQHDANSRLKLAMNLPFDRGL